MTKLNDKRIKWFVKQVVDEGRKLKDLAPVYDMSVGRVQHLSQTRLMAQASLRNILTLKEPK